MINSTLEQFQVFSLFRLFTPHLSFTNQGLTFILISVCLFACLDIVSQYRSGFIIPGRFQVVLEILFRIILTIVYENAKEVGVKFFPFIFSVCLFIFLSNIIGLIPFTFTITTHLIVTVYLSFILFVGIIILIVQTYGLSSLRIFIPQGTSLYLSLLLVPIETISFVFKPLSLGIRLFSNIIAGHTLLKVIGGFSWAIIVKGGIYFWLHFIPFIILLLLFGLEFVVAVIQTYVFLILFSIYFRESLTLH